MTHRRFLLLSLVWILLSLPIHANPLPSGLADPAGRTGYFTMIRGQVEAIDLQTGDTLWASERAHRALIVVGDRLYALSKEDGPRLVGLDLHDKGQVVLTTEVLPLPIWSSLRDEPGQSFRTQTRVVPDYLEIHWEARAWYVGSEKAMPEKEKAARKHASGLIRVHLLTGKFQANPADFPQTPPALPPATIRESIRWSGTLQDWLFALVVDQTSQGQSALLRSWNLKTNQELPSRPVLTGRRLQVIAGLGDRHLFVRDALPSPIDTDTTPVRWHIWDLERGAVVGQVPYEPGVQPGAVVGPRAYFVKTDAATPRLDRPILQPRTLQARDLRTGKLLWERPIEGKMVGPVR